MLGENNPTSLLSPFIWQCLPWTKPTQKPEGKNAQVVGSIEVILKAERQKGRKWMSD